MTVREDLEYIVSSWELLSFAALTRTASGGLSRRSPPGSRPPLNLDALADIVGSSRAPAMYTAWPDPQDYPPQVAGFGRCLLWWLPSCVDWAVVGGGYVRYPSDLSEAEIEDPTPLIAARIMLANALVIHTVVPLFDAEAGQAWEDHMRVIAHEIRRLIGEDQRLRCPRVEAGHSCHRRIVQEGTAWICPVHGVLSPQTATITEIARRLHVPMSTAHNWPERGLLVRVGWTKRGKPLYYIADARRLKEKRR
ncbi:MAG: hypothetical protein LBN10_05175 [Propionibacteriaceae bacterium]|nr:hypothetical protein [Propionibacteriaceae bacterium]